MDEVYKSHNTANRNANELVEFGEKLIAVAKRLQDQPPITAEEADLKRLKDEIKDVEKTLHKLAQADSHGHGQGHEKHLHEVEQTLIRHEHTLNALVHRIQGGR